MLPFDTLFYDKLYTNISSELKILFPRNNDEEDDNDWYKRLLYEFIKYLQIKYEPISNETTIPANSKKDNKPKKDSSEAPAVVIQQESLFQANIEKALDIVTQDSDFAIYLMAWWLPILLSPKDNDYFEVKLCIDCDATATGNTIHLKSIQCVVRHTEFTIVSINNKKMAHLTQQEWSAFLGDPFIYSILKIFFKEENDDYQFLENPSTKITYQLKFDNITHTPVKIARIFWRLKNIVKPLFISQLSIKSK